MPPVSGLSARSLSAPKPTAKAASAPSMGGVSSSKMDSLRRDAQQLVSQYDTKHQGYLTQDETQQDQGTSTSESSYRLNDSYVRYTTVYTHSYRGIDPAAFKEADTNNDGQLSQDEIVQGYLRSRDSNHDGKIGWWEGFKMMFSSLSGQFDRSWSNSQNGNSRDVYEPQTHYTPPPVDPNPPYHPPVYHPTPPPVNPNPPYHPPAPRPEPPVFHPTPSPRPQPPSFNPSPSHRPTPPTF